MTLRRSLSTVHALLLQGRILGMPPCMADGIPAVTLPIRKSFAEPGCAQRLPLNGSGIPFVTDGLVPVSGERPDPVKPLPSDLNASPVTVLRRCHAARIFVCRAVFHGKQMLPSDGIRFLCGNGQSTFCDGKHRKRADCFML